MCSCGFLLHEMTLTRGRLSGVPWIISVRIPCLEQKEWSFRFKFDYNITIMCQCSIKARILRVQYLKCMQCRLSSLSLAVLLYLTTLCRYIPLTDLRCKTTRHPMKPPGLYGRTVRLSRAVPCSSTSVPPGFLIEVSRNNSDTCCVPSFDNTHWYIDC